MDRVLDTIMRRRLILFGAALVWLLFVASFLMPVTKDGMFGWQAFWFYLADVLDARNYWREIQRNPWAILV